MCNKKFDIVKDEIWDSFKIDSIDYFKNLAKKVRFLPDVSEDVIKRFDVVKKLLIYSYFEYEFLDVAFERALSSFEVALKKRYFEIEKIEAKEKDLGELINWANSKGLFEDPKNNVDKIRELRNSLIGHPNSYSLFGNISLHIIFPIIDTINGLYENTDLRKLRKKEIRKVNKHLEFIFENGSIINIDNKKLIIFWGQLLYFNNTIQPNKYHFLFYPIFDPSETIDGVKIPKPITIEGKSWSKTEEGFFINTFDGKKIIVHKIKKAQHIEKFNTWNKSYKACKLPLNAAINIEISEIRSRVRKLDSCC